MSLVTTYIPLLITTNVYIVNDASVKNYFVFNQKFEQHLDHDLTPDSKKKLPYMAKLLFLLCNVLIDSDDTYSYSTHLILLLKKIHSEM